MTMESVLVNGVDISCVNKQFASARTISAKNLHWDWKWKRAFPPQTGAKRHKNGHYCILNDTFRSLVEECIDYHCNDRAHDAGRSILSYGKYVYY